MVTAGSLPLSWLGTVGPPVIQTLYSQDGERGISGSAGRHNPGRLLEAQLGQSLQGTEPPPPVRALSLHVSDRHAPTGPSKGGHALISQRGTGRQHSVGHHAASKRGEFNLSMSLLTDTKNNGGRQKEQRRRTPQHGVPGVN